MEFRCNFAYNTAYLIFNLTQYLDAEAFRIIEYCVSGFLYALTSA